MTDETRQAPEAGCSCQALNCPQCSSAETIEPVIVRATGLIRRARLTEAELDVCMQVGLHAVYAARRLDAQRELRKAQQPGINWGRHYLDVTNRAYSGGEDHG